MARFKVVEKFVSINGEGRYAGQLSVFIRFQGCNLICSYCDTMWANREDTPYEFMSEEEIYQYILSTKVTRVTLTGGEPLLQEGVASLLKHLTKNQDLYIEIETNGSVPIKPFHRDRVSFTVDYKLPSSGMETKMELSNFKKISKEDTVKFVVGSKEDLYQSKKIMEDYHLVKACKVYLSPVFGKIDPKEIVEFLMEHSLNQVSLQLQLHKFIWEANQKGV